MQRLPVQYSTSTFLHATATSSGTALHTVHLPYLGDGPNNLDFIPKAKVLFATQLILAAMFLALIVTGNVKQSLEEIVERMSVVQDSHTTLLNSHTTLLYAIAKYLGMNVSAVAPG